MSFNLSHENPGVSVTFASDASEIAWMLRSFVVLSTLGRRRRHGIVAMQQLSTTWKERLETSIATSRQVRGGNYVQLGTVDESGKPRVRTVVFRGFHADMLTMTTDSRSAKVGQSKFCEVCWWFPLSKEQYRLSGLIHYVGSDDTERRSLRLERWTGLSDASKKSFFTPNGPGSPWIDEAILDECENLDTIPENFLVVLVEATACDYLRLTDNFRQIDTRSDDDETTWSSLRVHP